MFPKQGTSKKAKKATEDPAELEDAAFEPIDVLVDTIIGYLEKSTAYMRSVSNQVFALISGSVKGTTIDLIVMVSLLPPLPPDDQR
jgi:DNA polymerase phi